MEKRSEGSAFARLGDPGLIEAMRAHLDDFLVARDKMEQLMQIVIDISSDLDLDAMLRRIVDSAVELTGASFCAMGVRGEDGRLAQFIHTGIDKETERRIGHLPAGKGVLGFLLDRKTPVRLTDLREHPAAVGFPEHHPPMTAFLGVPIIIRGTVYGSLYLADLEAGRAFTDSDEAVARALGSAASVAIDNAQLYQRTRIAAEWMAASREITTSLLGESEPGLNPLWRIAERARELTGSEQAIVLTPDDPEAPPEEVTELFITVASGVHADEVLGQGVPVRGSTSGEAFRTGVPVITEYFRHPIPSFTDAGERPAIVVPLRSAESMIGVLAVARAHDQPSFESNLLALMSDFADHAAIALTLSDAREQARESGLLADRERIAQDLHDHVIQRLFAAGLSLQGAAARIRSPEPAQRVAAVIDDLQATIEEIRSTIFGLHHSSVLNVDFRQRIQRRIWELTQGQQIETNIRLSGPMSLVEGRLADHAQAVVTEAVSNSLRHSGARRLTIEIVVSDDSRDMLIVITDNGRG
ncbi:MAG: GAF domain-containing protein, partial [Mycobacterium sp.]|nr:GAF domain-containing protein [Mycobacterium sp.]